MVLGEGGPPVTPVTAQGGSEHGKPANGPVLRSGAPIVTVSARAAGAASAMAVTTAHAARESLFPISKSPPVISTLSPSEGCRAIPTGEGWWLLGG